MHVRSHLIRAAIIPVTAALLVPASSVASGSAGLKAASYQLGAAKSVLPSLKASTFSGVTTGFPCKLGTDDVFCGNVNINLTRDMKRVKLLMVGFEAPCISGDHYFARTYWAKDFKTKASKRSRTFKREAALTADLEGGFKAQAAISVAGKVRSGHPGGGTFSAVIGVTDPAGQVADTCKTDLTYKVDALKEH